jgi:hypothetical protein
MNRKRWEELMKLAGLRGHVFGPGPDAEGEETEDAVAPEESSQDGSEPRR